MCVCFLDCVTLSRALCVRKKQRRNGGMKEIFRMHISCETMERTSNANNDSPEYVPILGLLLVLSSAISSPFAFDCSCCCGCCCRYWYFYTRSKVANRLVYLVHLNANGMIIKRTWREFVSQWHSITVVCYLLTWIIFTFPKWCSHIDKPKWPKSIKTPAHSTVATMVYRNKIMWKKATKQNKTNCT